MVGYDDPAVQRAVVGVVNPVLIATQFVEWSEQHLGSVPVDCWLWAVSVGCVAGLDMADGSQVVVKAYPRDRTEAVLRSMQEIQRVARSLGLPVPEPLGDPAPLGRSLATAETALLDGRHPRLRQPADGMAAARGFVEFIEALRGVSEDVARARPRSERSGQGLYPVPHSPLFDFDATRQGAAWIDALAGDAKATMDRLESPMVLAHMDWRAENLRISAVGDRVVAIYDCDAIRREREAIAVGEVAATHSVDWSDPDGPYFASGTECLEFARTIESVREHPFADAEWTAIRAGIVYAWCYTARCEHARAMVGDDAPKFKMRARLAADGPRVLDGTV